MDRPRIAIPEPHSAKPDYNQRVLPQYEQAVREAGGEPVIVPLDAAPEEVARLLTHCDAVLLPGSSADVDPQKYDATRDPRTKPADPLRDMVDELLLQDAYNMRKPVFGICYGLQSLNVWRTGTLVQHLTSGVNHEAGRQVAKAHAVRVDPVSKLAAILGATGEPVLRVRDSQPLTLDVNSSHHQAAATVGDGLRVVARCPEDQTIEAVEGAEPGHFVLAVQWHPERTTEDDAASRALFRALVEAARQWKGTAVADFEHQHD